MKKYLVAVLALVSVFILTAAPAMAVGTAYYVDFSLIPVTNSLNVSGDGSLTQNTGVWTLFASDNTGAPITTISITGGTLNFNTTAGTVAFTGAVVGKPGTFTITGQALGFHYTATPNPQWDWNNLTWNDLTPLNYGAFQALASAYNGSFSVDSTGTPPRMRYTADGPFSPVPIPSSLLLLAPSALGIMVMMRKKRKK